MAKQIIVQDAQGKNISADDFVDFLENTLIPDLYESGRDATAEDFETAVKFIKQLNL